MKLTILSILPLSCMMLPCSGGEKAADDGLRKAAERAVYRVEPSGHETYRGANPAQRLAVEFDTRTARLQHAQRTVALRLTGYGYGEHLRTPAKAKPITSGARVEYRRGDLTEWYVNEARGLEQGFTLGHRPGTARNGEALVIAMAVEGGLRPVLAPAGDAVLLNSGGSTILRYGGLRAWDARGRAAASRLEVRERQVRLVVEDRNAEYPLVVDPIWTQEAELTAPNSASHDQFGYSVSISGNTAVIGAYGYNNTGAAYVFVRSGTTWALQQKLTGFDTLVSDQFGYSVSVYGDTAVIGAPGAAFVGAAYVFVRSATTWTQQQKLTASEGAANDNFGVSVAVSADTAVVGADLKQIGGNGNQGAAYVFVRSGTTWAQQQELTATASDVPFDQYFGISVSVSGDTAVIGAPLGYTDPAGGVAYVFVRSGTTWTQQQKLSASDGVATDNFGVSVAVSGETAVVGANANNNVQGAAYVFVRSGASWSQQQKLTASDGAANDQFGVSVAVSGDTAVVGADQKKIGSNGTQGAAYVFVRSGGVPSGSWTQQPELTASDGMAQDSFGISVSVSGDTALVGATRYANSIQGVAYVFRGPAATTPSLSVGKAHTGTFTQGQIGGEWDITVSNAAGSTATTGTTTVSDTLPTGYTVHDFATTAGSWMCSGAGTQTATCTSTLAVNGGSSFPPVQIVVSVPANSPTSLMNTGKAYGGGDTVHNSLANAATGSDSVTVVQVAASIGATAGSGQTAAVNTAFTNPLQATVLDANSVGVPNVTVTFAAPSQTGPSATFTGGTTAITNASGVATKAVTANGNAGGPYTVTATAGAIGPANFMLTNTMAGGNTPALSVTKMHVGAFPKGGTGEWDITVNNAAGSSATTGTISVSDPLPAGYTVHDFSTTAASWTCSGATTQTATCTSTLAVAGGGSFPVIKMIVNVPAGSPDSVSNTAKAYGGGDTVHISLGTAATGSDTVNFAAQVNAVSVSPASGVGFGPQTFTGVYTDVNGASDLQVIYMDFGTSPLASHSCVVAYIQGNNTLNLFNDAGNGLVSGTVTPGGAGTLTNSQCTISGNGGAVTAAGNTLMVPIAITFKPAFTGYQDIFGLAQSYSGSQGNGWQTLGSWTPGLGPVSVSPNNGMGLSQTFTAVYTDPNGYGDLQVIYLDIDMGIGGPHGCFVAYVQTSNSLYLFSDNNASVSGPITPGSSASQSNSQCTLSGVGGLVTHSGNNLIVPINLTFLAGYTGPRNIFGLAQAYNGTMGAGAALGTWTPMAAAPLSAVSVSPINSTGFGPQTFNAVYTDPNGASDIQVMYLDFGPSIFAANSCIVAYVPAGNALYLFNDANTGVAAGSPITAGTGATLANSQCTLSGAGGLATPDSNNLTAPFSITFKAPFASRQNVWGLVQSYSGAQSAWNLLGNWTP